MDLHPEELLDAEVAGTLAGADRERLDAHCRVCAPCGLLRAAQKDFARATVPTLRDEAVALAVLAAFEGRAKVVPIRPIARSSSASWGMLRVAAVLAVIAVAGSAGAVGLAKLGIIHISGISEPAPEPPRPVRAIRKPVVAPAVQEAPTVAPPVEVPVAEPAPAPAPRAARKRTEASPVVGAAELFASANNARRTGQSRDAVRLYGDLIKLHPDSGQASQARVSLGSLLLHVNNAPGRALQQFTTYLARDPNGPMAEEARVGRAMTLARLKRPALERQAWQDILERHPGSIHADQARRRLEELR